ncbi:MAG: imelysin family protein [Burkholderiaceae bacterium]
MKNAVVHFRDIRSHARKLPNCSYSLRGAIDGAGRRARGGLFAKNSTDGLAPITDKFMAHFLELHKRVGGLTFPPERVMGGAAVLLEEVAAKKVSGEEDRYSRTDLWDFQANVEGAKKIVDLFRPLIEQEHKDFFKKVDANFATVDRILAKYKTPDGFKAYDSVTNRDRVALMVRLIHWPRTCRPCVACWT